MRKRNLGLTGMLLSALVLAGCSNDETLTETENDGRVALQVTSGIRTRAVDNLWQADDAIGIYMLDGKGTPDPYYANMKYVTENSGESGTFNPAAPKNTIYLPDDGTARDFIAYYPWTDNKLEGSMAVVNYIVANLTLYFPIDNPSSSSALSLQNFKAVSLALNQFR